MSMSSAALAASRAAEDRAFAKANPTKPKPLAGCPLMRSPPAHMSPTRGLSPNRRQLIGAGDAAPSPNNLNTLVRSANVASGGTAGGEAAVIATLKSDLLLIQHEIDAVTLGGGMLEMQGNLGRFLWSPSDAAGNQATIIALQSLLLLKINELANLHTPEGSRKERIPSTSAGQRQSKVVEALNFFKCLRQEEGWKTGAKAAKLSPDEEAAAARAAQMKQISTLPPSPNAPAVKPLSSQDLSLDGPDWSHHQQPQQQQQQPKQGSSLPTPTDGIVARGNNTALPSPQLVAEEHLPGPATQQQIPITQTPLPQLRSSATTPFSVHVQTEELRAKVKQLQRQLSLFTYLEKNIHAIDYFDNSVRTAALNPALAELGIDIRAMGVSLPPHTMASKEGQLQKFKSTLGPCGPPPTAQQQGNALLGSSPGMQSMGDLRRAKSNVSKKSEPTKDEAEMSVNNQQPASADDGVMNDDSDNASGLHQNQESAAIISLRSLIAFQNAVVQLLIEELRAKSVGKGGKHHPAARPSSNPTVGFDGGSPAPAGQQAASYAATPLRRSTEHDIKRDQSEGAMSANDAASAATCGEKGDDDDDEDDDVAVKGLKDRIGKLERIVEVQREQLQKERESTAVHQERTANLFAARARTTSPHGSQFFLLGSGSGAQEEEWQEVIPPPMTPSPMQHQKGGSSYSRLPPAAAMRPLSRLTAAVPSSAAGNSAVLSGLVPVDSLALAHHKHRPGTNSPQQQQQRLGSSGPPLGRPPIVPTSQEQLDGVEKSLKRTIAEQANIIRDLQNNSRQGSRTRGSTADSSLGHLTAPL